jgi:hypothetical protein
MEPLLPRLVKGGASRGVWSDKAVRVEAMDALRRRVRFVCTSATLVGVVGRARRAAAAAAAESDDEAFGSWRLKTAAAAVAALGSAVAAVRGCWKGVSTSSLLRQFQTRIMVGAWT